MRFRSSPTARSLRLAPLVLTAGLLALPACSSWGGPDRARTQTRTTPHPEISFDRGLDVYVLEGTPHHFLYNARYLRFESGRWQVADDWNGEWRTARPAEVPTSLKQVYANVRREGGAAKQDDAVPAKGDW